MVKKSATD